MGLRRLHRSMSIIHLAITSSKYQPTRLWRGRYAPARFIANRAAEDTLRARPRRNRARAASRIPSVPAAAGSRSEEHTSELQSLMHISYAVFCLKKKQNK